MKIKGLLIVITALAGIALSSCKNNPRTREIALIDSLKQVIVAAEDTLKTVKFEDVENRYKLYKEYSKILKDNFYDIKTEENWPYICEYNNVRKPLKEMTMYYKFYLAEIDSSKIQLDDLKADLQEGNMNDEEFNTYFRLESENATDLTGRIISKVALVKKHILNFDTIHPYIAEQITNFQNKPEKGGGKKKK